MELFDEIELTDDEARAIGRAMLAVARADGAAEPREVALIEQLAPIDPAAPAPDAAELAAALPGADGRELLLRSALLVALVDGDYSDAEKALVSSWAGAFGVTPARLEELARAVKAFLMSPLVPLSNSPAVAEVSRKLKV